MTNHPLHALVKKNLDDKYRMVAVGIDDKSPPVVAGGGFVDMQIGTECKNRQSFRCLSQFMKLNVYLMHNHLFAVHFQSATWHNFQIAYLWHLANSCIDNIERDMYGMS